MCLAIPGSIVTIEGTNATIDMLGVQRRISISLTPQAQVGDYVLVHAGFAIEVSAFHVKASAQPFRLEPRTN